jgi:hypothetical protein
MYFFCEAVTNLKFIWYLKFYHILHFRKSLSDMDINPLVSVPQNKEVFLEIFSV